MLDSDQVQGYFFGTIKSLEGNLFMNNTMFLEHPEVGIYKRKQESKKKENALPTKKATKKKKRKNANG